MAENGNGKWQLAFWIVTLVCGIWLGCLTKETIAIDLRSNDKFLSNRNAIMELLKENAEQHSTIIADIRELKTLISRR